MQLDRYTTSLLHVVSIVTYLQIGADFEQAGWLVVFFFYTAILLTSYINSVVSVGLCAHILICQ
jgi:hypothetical protein